MTYDYLQQAAIKVIDFEDEHTRGLILMEIKVCSFSEMQKYSQLS